MARVVGGSHSFDFQCFDVIGWVIWPVKVVRRMTYEVSSGTVSLYTLTLT